MLTSYVMEEIFFRSRLSLFLSHLLQYYPMVKIVMQVIFNIIEYATPKRMKPKPQK